MKTGQSGAKIPDGALTIQNQWLASRTRRYHTSPMGVDQNLADHSWGVAYLISILHPNPSAALLIAALRHDLAESAVGDMPGPMKWANEEFANIHRSIEDEYLAERFPLNPLIEDSLEYPDSLWLKGCDLLELVLFADYQLNLGNQYANVVKKRGLEAIRNVIPARFVEIHQAADELWNVYELI